MMRSNKTRATSKSGTYRQSSTASASNLPSKSIQCQNLNIYPYYYQQEVTQSNASMTTQSQIASMSSLHDKRKSGFSQHQYGQSRQNSVINSQSMYNSNNNQFQLKYGIQDDISISTVQMDRSPRSSNAFDEISQATFPKQFFTGKFIDNQISSEYLDTKEDDQIVETSNDREFENVAKIYYSVNLIQRSFRTLKSMWAQSKRNRQLPCKMNDNIKSQKLLANNSQIYDMTFEQVAKQDLSKLTQQSFQKQPLQKVDPLYSGLINLEAIEESLQQFESISKSSMSSLLMKRNRNKSPGQTIDKMTQQSLNSPLQDVKFAKNQNLNQSPEKHLIQVGNNDLPLITFQVNKGSSIASSQSMSVSQSTPNLQAQHSVVSFSKPLPGISDCSQSVSQRFNDTSQISQLNNQVCESSCTVLFDKGRRSSINSICKIKNSILEINLILAMNKIKGFQEKNMQRQKILAFYEVYKASQSSLMLQKLQENELITRSLANDSILQEQKIQELNNKRLSLEKQAKIHSVQTLQTILARKQKKLSFSRLKVFTNQIKSIMKLQRTLGKLQQTKTINNAWSSLKQANLVHQFEEKQQKQLVIMNLISQKANFQSNFNGCKNAFYSWKMHSIYYQQLPLNLMMKREAKLKRKVMQLLTQEVKNKHRQQFSLKSLKHVLKRQINRKLQKAWVHWKNKVSAFQLQAVLDNVIMRQQEKNKLKCCFTILRQNYEQKRMRKQKLKQCLILCYKFLIQKYFYRFKFTTALNYQKLTSTRCQMLKYIIKMKNLKQVTIKQKCFSFWKDLSIVQSLKQNDKSNKILISQQAQTRSLFLKQTLLKIIQFKNLGFKQHAFAKIRSKYEFKQQQKGKEKDQSRFESFNNQLKLLQIQVGQQLSDKIEYVFEHIQEITNNEPLLSRIEAALALRISLDKFHLCQNNDQEILKLLATTNPNEQFKTLEKNINVKKDIFNEKNAKHLMKLIKGSKLSSQEQDQQNLHFKNYDTWEEGKISLESLCLFSYAFVNREKINCKSFSKFNQVFHELVSQASIKQFQRLSEEETLKFVNSLKDQVQENEVSQKDLKLQYQENLIKELEKQITLQDIPKLQNTERFEKPSADQLPVLKESSYFNTQTNIIPPQLNNYISDYIQETIDHLPASSLTSEKENDKQVKKSVKKKSKQVKKKIAPQNAKIAELSDFEKIKKPKLKKKSPYSKKMNLASQCLSNVSSSSDLFSFRKLLLQQSATKKKKKLTASVEKIKQQSLEITKLSQKVQEIESKMATMKNQQMPQTIIKIREHSASSTNSRQQENNQTLITKNPLSSSLNNGQNYFNQSNMIKKQNFQDEQIALLQQINRNLIYSQRKNYDFPAQITSIPLATTVKTGLRLGASAERYENSKHDKCTSRYCLICKQ